MLNTVEDAVTVYVPRNLTNEFQPFDITVNGPAKLFLANKFQDWYEKEVAKQLDRGIDDYSIKIDLNLSVKPLHAQWMIGLHDFLRNKMDTIIKGDDMAGITEASTKELEAEDPFADLYVIF